MTAASAAAGPPASPEPVRPRPRLGYTPGLDGLRGLFAALLIAYHFGWRELQGMWMALNTFFVVSGFFIARLLVVELQERGRISALGFYLRRARRLLPALFALLVVSALIGRWVLPDGEAHRLGGDLLATLGFVLNWRLIGQGDGYFLETVPPSLVRHAWTLSIEEQFYLLAPFLIMLLFRVVRGRWPRVAVAAAGALAAAAWTAYLGFDSLADYPRLYFGTDSRVNAILAGVACGIALAPDRRGRVPTLSRRAVTGVGIGSIVLGFPMMVTTNPYTPWMWSSGGLILNAVFTVGLIVCLADARETVVSRAFSLKPLVWLGKRTYGIYLWHWPIVVLADRFLPGTNRWLVIAGGLALTWVIAGISYRYLELPVIRNGLRGLRPRLGIPQLWLAGSFALVVGLSLTLLQRPASDSRVDVVAVLPGGGIYDPSAEAAPRELVAGQPAYSGDPARIAVLGDSVPAFLVKRFPRAAYPGVHLSDLTRPGCDLLEAPQEWAPGQLQPGDGGCALLKKNWPAQVRADRAEVLVNFVSPLLAVPHRYPDGVTRWLDDPVVTADITGHWDQIYAEALEAGLSDVVFVNATCRRYEIDMVPEQYRQAFRDNPRIIAEYRDPVILNGLLGRWLTTHPKARLLDLHAAQCGGGNRLELGDGIPTYNDSLHFSPQASPLIWGWLLGQLSAGAPS